MTIHAIWAMEDRATSFRTWAWLIPSHPATIDDKMAIEEIRLWLMRGAVWKNITSGPSFCHVSRKIDGSVGMPCRTSGTQKWNGTNPNLMDKARVSVVKAIGFVISVIFQDPVIS